MRLRGIAQTPEDFDKWVQAQKAASGPPPAGAAADGLVLFNAKGCGGCHTVAGVSTGQVGPNLSHVYSRQAFAGDTFDMTSENLRKWLLDPPGEKPGSKMPNLGLTGTEAANIVAYLQTLK
jgi:cytochrome c oxidase subunit 2